MCQKIGYDTKQEALADAEAIRIAKIFRHNKCKTAKSGKMTAYDCTYCDKWHLTSQRKRKY